MTACCQYLYIHKAAVSIIICASDSFQHFVFTYNKYKGTNDKKNIK